jgi:hypothetical protein
MRFSSVDYYLLTGSVIFIVLSIVLGAILFEPDEDDDTEIRVDDVYFVMKRQTGGTSIIEISVFVSNIGENDIDDLLIRAFSVETSSNLAKADSSVHVQNVASMTTAEGRLKIEVPNRDHYRIELLVFRDGRLDLRGAGTIDLSSIGTATDYRTYPDGGGGSSGNDIAASPQAAGSLCILLIMSIAAVAVVLFLVFVLRPKKGQAPEGIVPFPQPEVAVREGAHDAPAEKEKEENDPYRQDIDMSE